jgi:branched-subunit amino acid transport protein
MSRASFWLVIGIVGLGTVLMRTVPIMAHGRVRTPPVLERLLKHVPAAALTALIVPAALYLKTNGSYEVSPDRVIAAVVAALVAYKTKNVIATLVVGMAALWAVQAVL